MPMFSYGPKNTVSVVGNRTKLECNRNSSALPINWEFSSAGSSVFSYIYFAGSITETLSSRYKLDTDGKTRYDIVIDSVDLSHAGRYRCTIITEEFVHFPSYTADLVILASEPNCNTNSTALNGSIVDGGYIRMWCTVNYPGNWSPVMEWTRSNGQTVDADINYTKTPTTVTSSLTTQLDWRDNGVTFTCKTSFKSASTKINRSRRPGETLSTNDPEFQHWWNFVPNVLYAPRNLTIKPKKSVYESGDHLECSANGNPMPTYEWTEIETNRTIYGSTLTIDDNLWSDQNRYLRCTAYNTVDGARRHADETVTLKAKERSQNSTEQLIIIAIIAIGAICCLVLTLYLCNNRCPYKMGIARPHRDILQTVQINPYHIADQLDDNPTDRPRSVQAVQSPGLQGASGGILHHELPPPIYSEVRRNYNNDEPRSVTEGAIGYLPQDKRLPVYTEVVKNRNGSRHSDSTSVTAEATASQHRSPPKTHHGADGTQYMDVTSMRDLNARAPIIHPPMFSLVETYASIDHTVAVHPPPLPPKRQ